MIRRRERASEANKSCGKRRGASAALISTISSEKKTEEAQELMITGYLRNFQTHNRVLVQQISSYLNLESTNNIMNENRFIRWRATALPSVYNQLWTNYPGTEAPDCNLIYLCPSDSALLYLFDCHACWTGMRGEIGGCAKCSLIESLYYCRICRSDSGN